MTTTSSNHPYAPEFPPLSPKEANAAGRPGAVKFSCSHRFYMVENAKDKQAAREDLSKFFVGTFEDAKETYLIGTAEEIVSKVLYLSVEIEEPEWAIFSMLGPDARQLEFLPDGGLPLLASTRLGSR